MKDWIKHILLFTILIFISAALEHLAYGQYDSLARNPYVINRHLAIWPVYNMDGSWLHGKWGIPYNAPLLIGEHVMVIFLTVLLWRMMESCNVLFDLSAGWLYGLDLEFAAAVYRLIAMTYRPYTLDYLYIRGLGCFDFPDFCIGIGIGWILLWLVPMMRRYYALKRKQTLGMRFWDKLKWEWRLSVLIGKTVFRPKREWEEMYAGWKCATEHHRAV